MVGHITTSINTIMNRLTAQHHVGPPPEAPRGASKAALGSVADTLFVSKNRSQHGTLVLIQKTHRIWTSEVRFQNSLPADPPLQESTGCWRFRRRAGVGARAQPRHRTGAPIGQVGALQEPTGQCTRQIPTANACVVQQEPTLQRRRLRMSCTTAATKLVRARDAAPFACDQCAYRWRRARARLGMLLCMSCSCSIRV